MSYARQKAAAARQRGDAVAERYWLRVAELVDDRPPLTPSQIAHLRPILGSTSCSDEENSPTTRSKSSQSSTTPTTPAK